MQVFRDNPDLPPALRGAALVLGNFDGVHRGHAALIEHARSLSPRVGVLTFSPHPRLVTQPDSAPFLITPGPAKLALLAAQGVDFCIELNFTAALAAVPAETFVAGFLARTGAAHLVFGQDFRFGHKRGGDAALLRSLESRYGFRAHPVAPVLDETGERYSSTAVRAFLRDGDVNGAARLLGRPWVLDVGAYAVAARQGAHPVFRFGPCLKPAAGLYAVRLGGVPACDAVLRVEEGDDLGRLHMADAAPTRGQPLRVEISAYLGPARGGEGARFPVAGERAQSGASPG